MLTAVCRGLSFNPLPTIKLGDTHQHLECPECPEVSIHSQQLSWEIQAFKHNLPNRIQVSIHSQQLSWEIPMHSINRLHVLLFQSTPNN